MRNQGGQSSNSFPAISPFCHCNDTALNSHFMEFASCHSFCVGLGAGTLNFAIIRASPLRMVRGDQLRPHRYRLTESPKNTKKAPKFPRFWLRRFICINPILNSSSFIGVSWTTLVLHSFYLFVPVSCEQQIQLDVNIRRVSILVWCRTKVTFYAQSC